MTQNKKNTLLAIGDRLLKERVEATRADRHVLKPWEYPLEKRISKRSRKILDEAMQYAILSRH